MVFLPVQLIHVIRFACRGGTAKRLENDIFWFKKPSLLLHPVKMVHTRSLISIHAQEADITVGTQPQVDDGVRRLFSCARSSGVGRCFWSGSSATKAASLRT